MKEPASKTPREPRRFFLEQFGLTERHLEGVLGAALARGIDFADIYFEFTITEHLTLEEGAVKKATRNVSQGVGVRAVAGDKTGYAYSDEVTLENLRVAARTAKAIARDSAEVGPVSIASHAPTRNLYFLPQPPIAVPLAAKVALLQDLDSAARRVDPRIVEVIATLAIEDKWILILSSEGFLLGDVQPLARLSVQCIAQEGSNRQLGSCGGGGRLPFSFFTEEGRALRYARTAAEQALRNLDAAEAPAGPMTVVLGPGWPGVLLHEAVGHGLEGDFNRKGVSAYCGLMGQRVASPLCTVVDDGTLANRRGSLNCDDEGTPTQRTVLIEKGVLRGYLQDRLNARLMKMPLTGNGRRESFAHVPIPRMTNTFLLPGDATPEEIVRSVQRGLYAAYFGGGQVDITSGKFVFSASEAYLIEGGRITRPVKGATLIGNGPDVLTRITMVGNDLQLDEGIGMCGKDGQLVPVGVGLPTVRIEEITVGGTRT